MRFMAKADCEPQTDVHSSHGHARVTQDRVQPSATDGAVSPEVPWRVPVPPAPSGLSLDGCSDRASSSAKSKARWVPGGYRLLICSLSCLCEPRADACSVLGCPRGHPGRRGGGSASQGAAPGDGTGAAGLCSQRGGPQALLRFGADHHFPRPPAAESVVGRS